MYCVTNQFPGLKFLGPYKKIHVVHGLGKHYHTHFDTKLGHGRYSIYHIPCACTFSTSIIDQTWISGFPEQKQLHYPPIQDCTYWPVLGSFNNQKILKLSHKATYSE